MAEDKKRKNLKEKMDELYAAAVNQKNAQMALNVLDRFPVASKSSELLEDLYDLSLENEDLSTALCIWDRLSTLKQRPT